MVRWIFYVLLLSLSMGIVGCNEDDDTGGRAFFFNPEVPFGGINFDNGAVKNVTSFQANVAVLGQVSLSWKIPAIYKTIDHNIMIYKRLNPPEGFDMKCPFNEFSVTIICPQSNASGGELFLVEELDQNTLSYVDSDNISAGNPYAYFAFIKIDNEFSTGVRIDILTKQEGTVFEIPAEDRFWENVKWAYGQVEETGIPSIFSMNIGKNENQELRGGLSTAFSGNRIYVADTNNNRVLIYTIQGASICSTTVPGYDPNDEEQFSACLLGFIGSPKTPVNILGQSSGTSRYACGDPQALPNSECLTAPGKVVVADNKLFIFDSGNNRIVIHNELSDFGCLTEFAGQNLQRDCTPDAVIGKAGLNDLSDYLQIQNGNRILNDPSDLVIQDGSLFIADTGHHRIVKINNYANTGLFSCTQATWGGPLCQFSGILGQDSFFESETFSELVADDPSIISPLGLGNDIAPPSEDILRRYFRRPNRIKILEDGRMMISSNENFDIPNNIGGRTALFGRILIFDENPIRNNSARNCLPATFELGNCDANEVVGQVGFNRLNISASSLPEDYVINPVHLYEVSDFDAVIYEKDEEERLLLIAVGSYFNHVYIWNDLDDTIAQEIDGYTRDYVVLDPEGAVNTQRPVLQPDLKSICSIRVSLESVSIYITDCENNKVYEVQAADYTNL